jgi:small subunit ribosomal protein S1
MLETQEIVENENDFWTRLEFEDAKRKGKKVKTTDPEILRLEKIYDGFIYLIPVKNSIVNAKYEGIISNQHCFSVPGFKDYIRVDYRPSESKYLKNTNEGDMIDVLITKVNNDIFMIEGSIASIYENAAHQSLKSLDEDVVIMANVKSINPAGYDMEIIHEGITLAGFMPNTLAGINKLYDPDSIVGKSFEVMVESFSKEEGTYIVSRRKYLRTLIPDAIDSLNRDEVYTGHVTGTTPFGIFVEFNDCLTGMIHKANVLEEWQERLSEIKPGTQIQFYVKEIVKEKIILTQILRETLWDTIKNGQVLDGVVRDIKQFGVLVSLDQETMGLIHTSELEKLGKKFQDRQELKVKVLAVDRQNRKIFLTVG